MELKINSSPVLDAPSMGEFYEPSLDHDKFFGKHARGGSPIRGKNRTSSFAFAESASELSSCEDFLAKTFDLYSVGRKNPQLATEPC